MWVPFLVVKVGGAPGHGGCPPPLSDRSHYPNAMGGVIVSGGPSGSASRASFVGKVLRPPSPGCSRTMAVPTNTSQGKSEAIPFCNAVVTENTFPGLFFGRFADQKSFWSLGTSVMPL